MQSLTIVYGWLLGCLFLLFWNKEKKNTNEKEHSL
jgi:hypothetical protein